MSITRTLAAALAVGALAAPAAAQAKPAPDMHASVAQAAATAQRQDMRSPDARDAALGRHVAVYATDAPGATAVDSQSKVPSAGAPTWPANPQPVKSTTAATVAKSHDGVDWTTIALGIAGTLIAVGGIAFLANRRTPRVRATA